MGCSYGFWPEHGAHVYPEALDKLLSGKRVDMVLNLTGRERRHEITQA